MPRLCRARLFPRFVPQLRREGPCGTPDVPFFFAGCPFKAPALCRNIRRHQACREGMAASCRARFSADGPEGVPVHTSSSSMSRSCSQSPPPNMGEPNSARR